jgi:hypothetical protein
MAIILAITGGTFSATTTWTGGIVPGINDDAVANGRTITITSNVVVSSLRNNNTSGAAATGVFVMNTPNISLSATFVQQNALTTLISVTSTSGTCTISIADDVTMPGGGTTTTFISHTGGCNLNTNGNFYSNTSFSSSFNNVVCISKSSNGLLTHTGNIRAGNSNQANAGNHGILNTLGPVTINGNVLGNQTQGGNCFGVFMNNASTSLTIVGNVFGGNTSVGISVAAGIITIIGNVTGTATAGLSSTSGGNIIITGNVIGGGGAGLSTSTGGIVLITGNVTGGNGGVGISQSSGTLRLIGNQLGTNAAAVSFTSNGPLDVTGVPTAGGTSPAIVSTSTGIVQMTGPFINTSGVQAVRANRMFLSSTSTYWRINTAAGVQRQFSTTDYNGGYPGIPNVRSGVVFGELSEFTGTLIIPPTGSVRKDVPVDNTVGTAELTSADFLAAIDASTSGIGLRLKNIATVASVGAQVTGFTNN